MSVLAVCLSPFTNQNLIWIWIPAWCRYKLDSTTPFEIQKNFCSYPSPFLVRKNLEFSRTIWWGCVSGEFHLVISALFKFWLNFLSWALDYALMAKSTAFPFGFSSCKYQPFKTCVCGRRDLWGSERFCLVCSFPWRLCFFTDPHTIATPNSRLCRNVIQQTFKNIRSSLCLHLDPGPHLGFFEVWIIYSQFWLVKVTSPSPASLEEVRGARLKWISSQGEHIMSEGRDRSAHVFLFVCLFYSHKSTWFLSLSDCEPVGPHLLLFIYFSHLFLLVEG